MAIEDLMSDCAPSDVEHVDEAFACSNCGESRVDYLSDDRGLVVCDTCGNSWWSTDDDCEHDEDPDACGDVFREEDMSR